MIQMIEFVNYPKNFQILNFFSGTRLTSRMLLNSEITSSSLKACQTRYEIRCQFHQCFMSGSLLVDLTGTQRRVYSIKVGHNFQLSTLVKLGVVLLVIQNLSNTAFAHVKAASKHVDKIDPWQMKNVDTVCIGDLNKLSFAWWFGFRLEPVSGNDQAA